MDDLLLINGTDSLNNFLLQFTYSLNEALKMSMEYKPINKSYVYRVVLVKGKYEISLV